MARGAAPPRPRPRRGGRREEDRSLLASQIPDGSWPEAPQDDRGATAGPAYTTAMAVQALTVSYRLLPIYRR
ncbi:MAG: hypothetical protein HY721_20990 [Planctomycetes bacterium]|nr:hypothetical protein [Planctomycetota bacterium]